MHMAKMMMQVFVMKPLSNVIKRKLQKEKDKKKLFDGVYNTYTPHT